MAAKEPVSAALIAQDATTVLPWSGAMTRLGAVGTYWLATIHADGRPHVRPVLAVVADGVLYTTSNPDARKAKNLAGDPRCSITAPADNIDIVVEGEMTRVRDDATLQRVAEAYHAKYQWPVTIKDGAFDAPYGAPTAGPPPYEIYELAPKTVFAQGTNDEFAPRTTRFDF